jgi:hypothetical protein
MMKPALCILFAVLSAFIGVAVLSTFIGTTTSTVLARRMLLEDTITPEEKWKPVDCPKMLEMANDHTVWDPNKNELLARWTTTDPPFFISMNNWKYDPMRKGKFYSYIRY